MSFSLKISGGDLVMTGSNLGIVYGTEKLEQDLMLWVAERYNTDRFHPAMGSRLQDFIGSVIGFTTRSMIYGEVLRVLENYIKVQRMGLRQAPSLYSLSELLASINDIAIGVGFDMITVAANVSNGESQTTTIALTQGV